MKKILPKLCLALVPIILYLAIFVAFEPNNYFGLRAKGSDNSPIARIRAYENNPQTAIILGDSRMAHFDMSLVNETAKRTYANVSYGGASLDESIDEFYYLQNKYPQIDKVVLGVSFYTLNLNYRTANRMSTVETQLANPAAYIFNLEYNINTLTVIGDKLRGLPDVEETAEHTPDEYVDASGNKLEYRQNLIDYAATLQSVCTDYSVNEAAFTRLLDMISYCNDNGISITVVFPPMDDSVRTLVCEPNGIETAMQPVLTALNDSGAQVLDYEWQNAPDYPDTSYYDGFHLDTRHGLPDFTKTLFSEVN